MLVVPGKTPVAGIGIIYNFPTQYLNENRTNTHYNSSSFSYLHQKSKHIGP